MNAAQQVVQSRSANRYGRSRFDREMGARIENKMPSGKPASSSSSYAGVANGGKIGAVGRPSLDRLTYVTTCLVGRLVEVHVKNGSIISGIFHAANVEKDFGIVLKKARVTKDGSLRGQKPVSDTVKKKPQNMIIPARELVQVIAKDISLNSCESMNGQTHEKQRDLMIDSAISHSHHAEVERELQRWTPDEDVPECPELENIFDGTWNRTWDQFETNETLFGVKSTFNEELYTTKLEKGPEMRELEIKASRIAREIEGQETEDLHLAEERGIHLHDDLNLDEESRFSAVRREVDDGRFGEEEDLLFESRNMETFADPFDSVISLPCSSISCKKVADEARASSTCSPVDEEVSCHIPSVKNGSHSGSSNYVSQLSSDCIAKESQTVENEMRLDEKLSKDHGEAKSLLNEHTEMIASEEVQTSKSNGLQIANSLKCLSPSGTAYSPAQESRHSICESSESGKMPGANEAANSCPRPSSSASSTSERLSTGSALNGRGLSPSSSVGSLPSEKSMLNPSAKVTLSQSKLNPNAKSFTPSASLRPHVPLSEGSLYYPSSISGASHVHSVPMCIGPVVYSPQAAQMQTQQAFMHPNGHLQMIAGPPRPIMYMPPYPQEAAYRGRNFLHN